MGRAFGRARLLVPPDGENHGDPLSPHRPKQPARPSRTAGKKIGANLNEIRADPNRAPGVSRCGAAGQYPDDQYIPPPGGPPPIEA